MLLRLLGRSPRLFSSFALGSLHLLFIMSKPVLVFLPGAFHGPAIFTAVAERLETNGYDCICLSLLAVVEQNAVKDLNPDIEQVRKTITEIAEKGQEVMLIAHSWSGIVASGAVEGLSKKEREARSQRGGIVKVVFLCAFVPPENVTLIEAFGGTEPDWYDVKVSTIMYLRLWSRPSTTVRDAL